MQPIPGSTAADSKPIDRRTALKTGLAATALGLTPFSLPTWAFTPELDNEVVVSFLDMLYLFLEKKGCGCHQN